MQRGGQLPADAELVERLRRYDETAFSGIVREWSGGMLGLARQIVSTPDSAAEVLQETWIAMLAGLDSFEGRSALRTWVCTILVNTARRRAAQEGRTIPLSSLGGEDDEPTVDPARFRGPPDPYPGDWWAYPEAWSLRSPEQELLSSEIRDELGSAVEALPARQKIVIMLRDVQGYRAEEVSSILDISPTNQRVLLHRARATVRRHLESYFGTPGNSDGRGNGTIKT